MTPRGPLMFNPPPGWPKPPEGWVPPKGWEPDPTWPAPPPGWQLWVPAEDARETSPTASGGRNPPGLEPARIRAERDAPASLSVDQRLALLEAENAALRAHLETLGANADSVVVLDDERVLQEAGVYRYHHPLENAAAYRERLDDLSTRIAEMIKAGSAIEVSNTFTFDGSLAKGRAMTNDLAKLMLRAYNAEADNVVRALRAGNAQTAIKRLDAARASIARLGKMMEMHIADAFHSLRIKEIQLTADYLMKKEEEREAARAERERLREERKVQLELAAARERLEKERSHLVTVIDKLRMSGASDPELERKLEAVDGAIAQNDYRAANIRAGYVYVISNRGSFGGHVVKIGLTRRLEPRERIDELSDASVPFRFDIHAIHFSEDAVSLESELHQRFAPRRVNWANDRKEFFFVSPGDVRQALSEKVGNLLEFVEQADSTDYLQSVRYWPEHVRPTEPSSDR